MGEVKIYEINFLFDSKSLQKFLGCGLRQIRVIKIEALHTLNTLTTTGKTKFPPMVQTSLEKGGIPAHPILKFEDRLRNVCTVCNREQKSAYYYVGDPRSDRKFDHGIICMKCYVRTGNDIIIKMRIESL